MNTNQKYQAEGKVVHKTEKTDIFWSLAYVLHITS